MEKIKIIDMHVHLDLCGGLEIPNYGGDRNVTPDELRAIYSSLGIERGVIMPLVSPESVYAFQTNELAYLTARDNPDMLSWFCNIDPRIGGNRPNSDLGYFIEHYKNLGARGIGEFCPNMDADCPMCENLFEAAAALDMPVTVHIAPIEAEYGYYGIRDSLGLPRIERMLKKYPRLKLIGHSAMFWAAISGDLTEDEKNGYPKGPVTEGGRVVELMREYGNLYGDLSAGSGANAVMRDPEFGYRFIEEFSDRLYFGTDICVKTNAEKNSLLRFLDAAVESGRISPHAYRRVCRDNALALLGINE